MTNRKKSPFIKDKPSGTVPKKTTSIYIEELFKRSDTAIKRFTKNGVPND